MAPVREQAEFYATCHPPLCLRGVKEVIDTANEELGERLQEILYEPELPAFKLVSTLDDRDAVLQSIQQILVTLLKNHFNAFEDCSPCVSNEEDLLELDGDTSSLMTSWSSHSTTESALKKFDVYRFPAAIRDFDNKSIWRGLESHTDWTLPKLISEVRRFWNGRNVPADINSIERHFNCRIRWNKTETLVYIGTDHPCGSMHIRKAVDGFQNLVDFFSVRATTKHFILSDNQNDIRYVFQSFSRLGFDRTTYLAPDTVERCAQMARAATIRSVADGWGSVQIWKAPGLAEQAPVCMDQPEMSTILEGSNDRHPRTGGAMGIALLRTVGVEVMDDPLLLEGEVDSREIWNWASERAERCTKGQEDGQLKVTSQPLAERDVPEPVHLLDSSPPEELLGDEFVPLHYSRMHSMIYDEINSFGNHGSTEPGLGDSDATSDDSNLIEFDTSLESDFVGHVQTTDAPVIPLQIQELGIAFGALKLSDCIEKGEMDDNDETNDRQSLSGSNSFDRSSQCSRQALREGKKGIDTLYAKLWIMEKPRLRHLFDVLCLTPGKVGLELRFGRILLHGLDHNEVCTSPVRDVPSRTSEEIARYLESRLTGGEGAPGFSSLLSSDATDATLISKMKPHGFTISIDAESFAYEVSAASTELANAFLHCPHSAWDLKIAAIHHSTPEELEEWMAFSKSMVESLHVSYCTDQEILLELLEQACSPAMVEEIRMRRIVHYGNKSFPGSIMTITITRLMELQRKSSGEGGSASAYQIQARPLDPTQKAVAPNQWMEVVMQSRQGRKMFTQNDGLLYFGEKAPWSDSEDLAGPGGVLDELCWPAIGMIHEMDECGLRNDNGQARQSLARESRSAKCVQQLETSRKEQPLVFW
ncbi:hypothetical protein NLU13_3115 [Sarocladium strictum]|uniref:Uncharacterized protein n=1 Tax=Sarocladium strictum TaxID=5046 RepID=A0AA39LA45_SARSR|nr:hypothetical protein NLU13_3115 [Sarocladium strictum]